MLIYVAPSKRIKSEATQVIIDFIKFVEYQYDCTVTNLRSDNGREFVNRPLSEWLTANDIMHQYS